MSNFNWVDYIFLLIFLLSFLTGLSRGIVRELISLATLVAAFILAVTFANALAGYIASTEHVQGMIHQASSNTGVDAAQPISYVLIGISFAIIFASVVIVGAIIGIFINMAFTFGVMGMGNRLLGAIFGLARAYIITLVAIFVVQLTPLSAQYWWHQSQIVNYYQPAVHWLDEIVSPALGNMKETIGDTIKGAAGQVHGMIRHIPFF